MAENELCIIIKQPRPGKTPAAIGEARCSAVTLVEMAMMYGAAAGIAENQLRAIVNTTSNSSYKREIQAAYDHARMLERDALDGISSTSFTRI